MTSRSLSLQVFILLTNSWNDGFIGISDVASQKDLIGLENSSLTFDVIMPLNQTPIFVSLLLDGFVFASFPFRSTKAITPYASYINSTTITREQVPNTTRKKYKVVFDPLKAIHAGVLTCMEGLDHGWKVIPWCGQGIKITVIRKPDPPSVSIISGSHRIGEDLTLHCRSRSRSLPFDNPLTVEVLWNILNDMNDRLKRRLHVGKNKVFTIRNITMGDKGIQLQCATADWDRDTNLFLKSKWGPVYTIRPYSWYQKPIDGCTDYPNISSNDVLVVKNEGQEAEFTATLRTCGDLSWHRETINDPILGISSHKFHIVYGKRSSTLIISNLTAGDAGIYICRAVNDYGTAVNFKFELKVTLKPRPSRPPLGIQKAILTIDDRDKRVVLGTHFTMTCHVQPEWKIHLFQWHIVNSGRYRNRGVENNTFTGDWFTLKPGKYSAWCRGRSGTIWTAKSDLLHFIITTETPILTPSVWDNTYRIVIVVPATLILSCKTENAVAGIFYNFYKDYSKNLGRYVPTWHTKAVNYTVPTLQAARHAIYTCTSTVNNVESFHSPQIEVIVRAGPKTPTLTSSLSDSVVRVNTILTLKCYSESERSATIEGRKTHYHFYSDGKKITSSNTEKKVYKVPTNQPAPPTVYTCTAVWIDEDVVESNHSSPRKLTVVGNLQKPILNVAVPNIEGERLTMECTSYDSEVTSFRFTFRNQNYDRETNIYTDHYPLFGKHNASCQYFIGEVGSPHSPQLELLVRPQTPTLTPTIHDVVVSVGEPLTLTCETKSFYPKLRKTYKFFKEKNEISNELANTFKIPTDTKSPLSGYTCTVTMATLESCHSLIYVVEIVAHGKPSLNIRNNNFIDGGSFTMNCTPAHEDAVKFIFYYEDDTSVEKVSNTLIVNRPDIGKYEARCRFYGTDGSRSPLSNIIEVTVLPKTPSLSSSLPDSAIRVGETLTLICTTESVGDAIKYSFYIDNNLTPGSPFLNNTYQVPTHESVVEVDYTCTTTIASVESLHSSQYRVTIYEPFSSSVVLIAILVTMGILLFVCLLAFMYLRKRSKKNKAKSVGVQDAGKSGAKSLQERSAQGTGQYIGSSQGPLIDDSTYSGTRGVYSDMSKPQTSSRRQSGWQTLRSLVNTEQESKGKDQNSGLSEGESSMNYFKSFSGWQSSATERDASTEIDSVTENPYDFQGMERRESYWERLKLQHLKDFVAEHENESVNQQSWQESSLHRTNQDMSLRQTGENLTDTKKVPESCWQRLVPRCLRKQSAGEQARPDRGKKWKWKMGPVPIRWDKYSDDKFSFPSSYLNDDNNETDQAMRTKALTHMDTLYRKTDKTLTSVYGSEVD